MEKIPYVNQFKDCPQITGEKIAFHIQQQSLKCLRQGKNP